VTTFTPVSDIFDLQALEAMLRAGMVRAQTHPDAPLTIYNYTEACVYANEWNPVTLACRGLVVDAAGNVLARPFAKFFNQGQPGAPTIGLDEPVTVTDKADGSLGVIYPAAAGPAVATRGSFASDQAIHATELLRSRYPGWTPPAGLTVLVEIIYPRNRIVVDYGGLDDLMLLGAVEIATGRSFGPAAAPWWPGPVVETFDYPTFGAALAAPPRVGREGLVVHVPATDVRIKLKYEEYVRLHRVVTGLSARTVWEALVNGATVAEIAAPLPDEFHGWVRDLSARLHGEVRALADAVEARFDKIIAELGGPIPVDDRERRKAFAAMISRDPLRGQLFARLDGKSYHPSLWRQVQPDADEQPVFTMIRDSVNGGDRA
jgi:RNA ligase